MSKLSTTTLTSFLFSFLISVPSRSISAADELHGKTDAQLFSTCFEITVKLFGCLLEMTDISSVFEKKYIFGKRRFLDKSLVKRVWIILRLGSWSILEHEGLCSEANISQLLCSVKCFWHAFLMLSIVTFSYSNGTKSLCLSRDYFMVLDFGSVFSLCTLVLYITKFTTPSLLGPHTFSHEYFWSKN